MAARLEPKSVRLTVQTTDREGRPYVSEILEWDLTHDPVKDRRQVMRKIGEAYDHNIADLCEVKVEWVFEPV